LNQKESVRRIEFPELAAAPVARAFVGRDEAGTCASGESADSAWRADLSYFQHQNSFQPKRYLRQQLLF
jgi:hypothetical protein